MSNTEQWNVAPWVIEVVDAIWDRRKEISKQQSLNGCGFDFPNYGGIPGRLYRRMSSQLVDWLRENIDHLCGCRTRSSAHNFFITGFFDNLVEKRKS